MMRTDDLLERHAQWQRSRRTASRPEKIGEAERLRPSIEVFQLMRANRNPPADGHQQSASSADPHSNPQERKAPGEV